MNGFNYILSKQVAWARRNSIELVGSQITTGQQVYTKNLVNNFFEPLLQETIDEINNGDGGELKSDDFKSPKMSAVHSSSVIGVNVIQYWKNKDISDISTALGLSKKGNKSSIKINFEQKFKISDKFRFDPNIDAVIYNEEQGKIKALAIECKYSEAYSSRKHEGLKSKYLIEIPEQWKDIPNLLKVANQISPNDNMYNHLHPAQLIKHILALKKTYGKKGFRLLYLWYDVLGNDGFQHRKEIEAFASIAKQDKIQFHSLSYQELIIRMSKTIYKGNENYIDYLSDRYL